MATNTIDDVLRDMRDAIDKNKFLPIDRTKNLRTLSILGITWQHAKDEIYELTSGDYVSGSEIDRNYPSSDMLWKFKKIVNGNVIYIKFKVLYQENGEVKVISFHIDNI